MKYHTKAIVLKRINYGEADRIITALSPDKGKISFIAKGVRRTKSKLAGGIELLSVSQISLVQGRGKLDTLVSSRLEDYFDNIISDYQRLDQAYWLLKNVDQLTDSNTGNEYFSVTEQALRLLNNIDIELSIISAWVYLQVMKLNGSLPNLLTDNTGNPLEEGSFYNFSVEDGNFFQAPSGQYDAEVIKCWRVMVNASPHQLVSIGGLVVPAKKSVDTLQEFVRYHT